VSIPQLLKRVNFFSKIKRRDPGLIHRKAGIYYSLSPGKMTSPKPALYYYFLKTPSSLFNLSSYDKINNLPLKISGKYFKQEENTTCYRDTFVFRSNFFFGEVFSFNNTTKYSKAAYA